MANTLTNLTPDIFSALDVVSRELTGLIPSVYMDASSERAALNQTIRSFVAPASSASNVTPGLYAPDDGNQTFSNKTITISKSKYVPIRWNGEEQKGMNTGPGYNLMLQDQFAQAMRVLANEVEADLASLFYKASRAVSPAGTTLFDSTNLRDIANVRKILVDNGAPTSDMSLVLSTLAGAAMRGVNPLNSVSDSGNDRFLRQGELLNIHGMKIRESGQIKSQTAGTAASATVNNAGYAVGATVLTLSSAGTGTILQGDVVSFAGDPNKYVVVSGDADVSGGGTITIAEPGLRVAMSAATKAITVDSSTDKNMAFSRNAIVLITRAPARPVEGDMADDVMIVQDPRSGLAFEVAMYKQYRQIKFEVSLAWGYEMIKPEHCALLID